MSANFATSSFRIISHYFWFCSDAFLQIAVSRWPILTAKLHWMFELNTHVCNLCFKPYRQKSQSYARSSKTRLLKLQTRFFGLVTNKTCLKQHSVLDHQTKKTWRRLMVARQTRSVFRLKWNCLNLGFALWFVLFGFKTSSLTVWNT